MTTVDNFLKTNIGLLSVPTFEIPNRDKRILISLSRQLTSGLFLTENQGKLLVKIIKENLKQFSIIDKTTEMIVDNATWSSSFRVVKKIKKIYISHTSPDLITIEFSFNNRLRDKVLVLSANLKGGAISSESKYHVQLSEPAIKAVVEMFSVEDFEIDQKILDFYQEISEIEKVAEPNFSVFDEKNENLRNQIKEDIGEINVDNLLLLHDRKIRYQYKISEKIEGNSLAAKLALRTKRKVFIDSAKFSLTDVVASLVELKRLHMMVIFEGHDHKINKNCLSVLENSLSANNILDSVGIYFRFEKSNEVDNFNAEIARLGYNKPLNETTNVVGIATNKLPKFVLKNKWKPDSVISFTTAFKNNRSAVYCSDVDLIIYYGDKMPLNEDIDVLV
jgi:hypothetical protein